MRCIDCDCCKKGWFKSKPEEYVCTGVKEPFLINNIYHECTEYPEKRNKIGIKEAINHYKYGIDCDVFSEPVTTYAKMAMEALEKQIPKTPFIWEDKYYFSPTPNDDWGYECPCCGNRDIDYPEHHCECGQALDWEELV
jgi:hypothetical protein